MTSTYIFPQVLDFIISSILEEWKAKFWLKIDVKDKDSCWDSKIGRDSDGYGITARADGTSARMHMMAFAIANNKIDKYGCPTGVKGLVLHRCNIRCCCNPNHLYEGDIFDNAADRNAAGRGGNKRVACLMQLLRHNSMLDL